MTNVLQSLRYCDGKLQVIDQLKLPTELDYVDVANTGDAFSVIRSMQVRGAPLIAIVAALGLAVDVRAKQATFSSVQEAESFLLASMETLRSSRPTAVNLFVAMDELGALVKSLASEKGSTVETVCSGYVKAAEDMLEADIATNKSIGDAGARRILEISQRDKLRVLTICNTGSLATAGYGTALGVIRSLHAMGNLEHVYACETRPYNQGARLTAFEIVSDSLPGTLIGDSMASYLMAVKGIDCVVVGADRVAANGDTANKIGTLQLAIAAKYFGIPFFAAVPTTTLDLSMSSGASIPVEERPSGELTSIFGKRIAPEGINVWNPAFDVTPSPLIRGIITEVGVAEGNKDGVIDMPAFLRAHGMELRAEGAVDPVAVSSGYRALDVDGVREYVKANSSLRRRIGFNSSESFNDSRVKINEVGDGNLNLVFIVEGPGGVIVIKQALPYVRCVGESWPLTLERAVFEQRALVLERERCADHVPEMYLFDQKLYLFAMEYIPPPHLILRKFFIAGERVDLFADHLSTFMANTLYKSSALAMSGADFRLQVSEWSRNVGLCALTEQVIFSDPYTVSSVNHWTSPQLDDFAAAIRSDDELKSAIFLLKRKFLSNTESLLHGDLHSGSIMATATSTMVIDPEFAFYGPMGFDTGLLLANLLLAYFSQDGYPDRKEYSEWILAKLISCFDLFAEKFLALWETGSAEQAGELHRASFPASCSDPCVSLKLVFMQNLWSDTIGFAAAEMIRRIVGIAHVADLDGIEDPDIRAQCEKKCLVLARRMMLASKCPDNSAMELGNPFAISVAAREVAKAPAPSVWPSK